MVDTPFLTWAFPQHTGGTPRTMQARLTDIVNVLDYGADNTGTNPNNTAISNAIAAAVAIGGGIVFFPAGNYRVTAPITNTSGSVRLLGSGRNATTISGNFHGFIIDQSTHNCIVAIEHMTVTNGDFPAGGGTDIATGAIRFSRVLNGLINSVVFAGWTGISMPFLGGDADGWETMIIACGSPGGPGGGGRITGDGSSGCIGIYCAIGGVGIYDTGVLAYNVGMNLCWSMNVLSRTRTEGCCTGLLLGYDPAIAGGRQCSGTKVLGHSTERCDTAVDIRSMMYGVSIDSCLLTGSIGAYHDITSIVGNGTTATVTSQLPLANFGWTAGTRQIGIEVCTDFPGFNTGGFVIGTYQNATQFTYLNGTVGTEPHHGGGWPTWSFKIQYGLRMRSDFGGSTISNVQVTDACEVAGIDLYGDGSPHNAASTTGNWGLTMIGCDGGAKGWLMPVAAQKSQVQYISCDQPRGSTNDAGGRAAGMTFAYLPGGASNSTNTVAMEDMEFTVIDGASTALGGTVTAGGSTGHYKVRYVSGTGWIRIG